MDTCITVTVQEVVNPPNIAVTSVEPNKTEVLPDTTVQVDVTLSNSGGDGQCEVYLTDNDVEVDRQTVTVLEGLSETVNFEVLLTETGLHNLCSDVENQVAL